MIHGGPHGQQGPAFNLKAQVYAAKGWASLMVNYRGSTGYGQAFADAIFNDQNGGEAEDVLAGVDAALARYPWIDRRASASRAAATAASSPTGSSRRPTASRRRFPSAGITNLVSFNYMAYYHDYLAVEFGAYPHEPGVMDMLWERSPLRYVPEGEDADADHSRRERQRRADRRGRAVLHRAEGRRRRDRAGPLPARRARHPRAPPPWTPSTDRSPGTRRGTSRRRSRSAGATGSEEASDVLPVEVRRRARAAGTAPRARTGSTTRTRCDGRPCPSTYITFRRGRAAVLREHPRHEAGIADLDAALSGADVEVDLPRPPLPWRHVVEDGVIGEPQGRAHDAREPEDVGVRGRTRTG